mmetsp:Transcript_18691/g.56506  ORF Transcript_18691/g.56506 Transcript_18691/m.56506 type:complete len:924 (-) Transcript_18691:2081-4852(-)
MSATDGGFAWQPQEEATAKICNLFTEFQNHGTNQSQVLTQLERCRAFPDFNNYLALILAQGGSLQLEIRQSAGLLLKNNLKQQYAGSPPAFQEYIKASLLVAISNEARPLRQVVGTNIATIVAAAGFAGWPHLLPALVACLESDSLTALDGALDALYKVFEEVPNALDGASPTTVEQLAGGLVPRILQLFASPHTDIKVHAVGIMNALMGGPAAPALAGAAGAYREGLFGLARDGSAAVRRGVCAGIVQLLSLQPEGVAAEVNNVVEYMLQSSQDDDEGLALEACEFWAAFCDSSVDVQLLRPHLGRVVPMLLKNMIYDEFDDEVVDTEAAEAGLPSAADHDADVRPFHHRASDAEGGGKDGALWNLRKCSAAALDVLSTVFAEELLPFVTPTVRERLSDKDWRSRESAILALGAISEGCHRGLIPYIGELVSLLIPCLTDARPLVRSITCWTLSRYSHWVVQNGQESHSPGQLQFDLVIEGLLGRVLDSNKHVQEAACSALATLEEQAGTDLLPRLKAVLETLAAATLLYGRRNVRMLYDALSTLAEAVGRPLGDSQHLAAIMPALNAKWSALPDSDPELLPLLECFMTVATAIGPAFEEYGEAVYARCMRILAARLTARSMAAASPTANGTSTPTAAGPFQKAPGADPEADLDYIVCCLDTLSGVAEALSFRFERVLTSTQPALQFSLQDVLLQCCQDPSPDIRQSAFALVGDLARVVPQFLSGSLTELVALTCAHLEGPAISPATMSACNNACWSLGELSIKQRPEDLAPFAAPLVERLAPVLGAPLGQMPRSLLENAAITLGRIAWVCPQQVAPHLEHFLAPWCGTLRLLNDGVEKEHAFQGLCQLVRQNPQAAAGSFKSIVEAVMSWQTLHNDALAADILQILRAHQAELEERGQWATYLATLSPAVRTKMLGLIQHS